LALAIPFPAFDPVAIELGPLVIRWYALAYVAGILLGWRLALRIAGRPELFGAARPPSQRDLDDMVLWAALGIIIGGRIGFVLFYNLGHYVENPLEIPQVWKGGMAFHGGAAGMIVAAWLFARSRGLSFLSLIDVIAAVAPIGLFFGRVANFINGELWGRVTDVPWAVIFPFAGPLGRHPSQLYQAGLEGLALFALLLWLVYARRALATPGVVGGAFLAGYGAARFVGEFFREPDAQLGYLVGGLTMGQLLSLPMIAVGLAAIVIVRRRARAAA
jgi:phosphatidylglycerol:prolipoprotein diacylglycerol transferase